MRILQNEIRTVGAAYIFLLSVYAPSVVSGCGAGGERVPNATRFERTTSSPAPAARGWPEADALFQRDAHWLGGDGALTISLGDGRLLWLFGDSFTAEDKNAKRNFNAMVRNSIAVQAGNDPSRASLRFYWRHDQKGHPASFFSERDGEWLWPGHGILLDGELTIFLYRVARDDTAGSLGFTVVGWTAVRVERPNQDPLRWELKPLPTPDTGKSIVAGAAVVQSDDHVYAFAIRGSANQDILILRWPITEFKKGTLAAFEWWGGADAGWGSSSPAAIMTRGMTEFSVSQLPGSTWWIQVQSTPLAEGGNLAVRYASRLTGPWTDLCTIYHPSEAGQPNLLLYAGKAHPQLRGADLVATYVANSLDLQRITTDRTIYFPRFVRIDQRSMLQTCPLPR